MTVDYRTGDTRALTAELADGSVDLIASSPPFLALRSYLPAGHDSKGDEIGSEANPAAFIDTLLALTAEWGRVLAAHGSIAIELGDTYSGSGGAGGDYNPGGLREGQQVFKANKTRYSYGQKDGDADRSGWSDLQVRNGGGTGWPLAKSLALIPQLYAVALAYGINPLTGQPSPAGRWRVRNVIVWHRPNPAVGALGDKVRPSTSYIVVATRSAKRWFDLTAVRTVGTEPGVVKHRLRNHSAQNPSTGWAADNEWCHQNPAGAPPLDCWTDQHDGTHETWTLTTQPSSLAHYAMWPAKLAERLILMMCPAEVCRVCGEPRRRMEGRAEYVDRRGIVGGAPTINRGGEYVKGQRNVSWSESRSASTLGWTDCGHCNCTCSTGFLATTLTGHAPECPTHNYRPGVVLDPFAGTGTTLAVADLHGRDAIGFDLDPRNRDIYPARHDECRRALFGTQPEMPGQLDMFAGLT
jgi:hypothetical protein